MMHSAEDTSSASSNDMIFSPGRARRQSLHQSSTPEISSSGPVQFINDNDPLPVLQDNSWIGARVSPIHSFDDEDNQEDMLATAPYRKAINESIGSSSSFILHTTTERTSLLGRLGGRGTDTSSQSSSIHPLWDDDDNISRRNSTGRRLKNYVLWVGNGRRTGPSLYWIFVASVWIPGILLACIGIHDAYLCYISFRRGIQTKYTIAWTTPWLVPSARTLLRFGAFCPARTLLPGNGNEYWRVLSSMFVSTSVIEWLLLVWAWTLIKRATSSRPKSPEPSFLSWTLLYTVSIFTGQLWMAALKENGIAGCASWGTCGILCATGASKPDRRLRLFLAAIALVLLDLVQPYSSTFGALAGSYFGWAFHGVGMQPETFKKGNSGESNKSKTCLTWLSALVIVKLWVLPAIIIISKEELQF